MIMEKFIFIFNNKPYNAVRFSGKSVDIAEIVLAENALNDAVMSILDNMKDKGSDLFNEAYSIDSEIFGYCDNDVIEKQDLSELEKYARMLL